MSKLDIIPSPPVRLLTALAETVDLADAEYRAIYDRVAEYAQESAPRGQRGLRGVTWALQSTTSFGTWGRYASGQHVLTRSMKNELRGWAQLPLLPPTVLEVVTAAAHPDAAVLQIGSMPANRILLLGADVPAAALQVPEAQRLFAGPVSAANAAQVICTPLYTDATVQDVHLSPVRRSTPSWVLAAAALLQPVALPAGPRYYDRNGHLVGAGWHEVSV